MTDVSTNPLLEVAAQISLSFDGVKRQLKENLDWQKMAKRTAQPSFYDYQDSVIIAGGFGVIKLAGPDFGHIWYVRNIVLFDQTGGVNNGVTGTCWVCVSSTELRPPFPTTSLPPGFTVKDEISTQPKLYSPGQLVVKAQEDLYVVITAGTNAHTYAAGCRVQDFQEGAFSEEWSL